MARLLTAKACRVSALLLVDRGVAKKSCLFPRRPAKPPGKKPTGHGFPLPNEYGEAPMNLVFEGGDSSLEEMVASTDRGLLVTRLWYIREVDPYEKVMTGMTRDGLFLVEKGKVASAVAEFPIQSIHSGDATQRRTLSAPQAAPPAKKPSKWSFRR